MLNLPADVWNCFKKSEKIGERLRIMSALRTYPVSGILKLGELIEYSVGV